MQPDKVIEARVVRGPSGQVLIAVDGPCGQQPIFTPVECVHTALLMLAVAGNAFDSATEFAAVIDRARASIALQPSGGPLQYQPSSDGLAARPQ
jgi:hypothetical protein